MKTEDEIIRECCDALQRMLVASGMRGIVIDPQVMKEYMADKSKRTL